jgi:CRISPR-associated protein Csx10
LAARWIRHHGTPRTAGATLHQQFLDLFETGQVRFGPAYPAGSTLRWLSVLEHKYGRPPGCATADIDLASRPDEDTPHRCADCGEPLQTTRPGLTGDPAELLVTHTHTAIGADDRPVDGQLYTRQRLRSGTTLNGVLTGPPELLDLLLDDDTPLSLGGNRTASGRASLHREPGTLAPPQIVGTRLILRLHSPAIFLDPYGRSRTSPDPVDLAHRLGVDHVDVVHPSRWVRTDTVAGWHQASNLPKPTEHVATAGSVYLVDCDRTPDPTTLAALARDGIGLRRHEGFGWISHPNAGATA